MSVWHSAGFTSIVFMSISDFLKASDLEVFSVPVCISDSVGSFLSSVFRSVELNEI